MSWFPSDGICHTPSKRTRSGSRAPVRWLIALSFGRRSQLKLNVCLERTPDKDEDVESFFSVEDAGFEEGEIPASDLTLQGSCFECIVCSFRIMTLRSRTDSLPVAVCERR